MVTAEGNWPFSRPLGVTDQLNKIKRSCSQLDSRKQVIAFNDRVTTIHKGSSDQHPLKWKK